MKTRIDPKYKTNKKVRNKIDRLLFQNARNISNSGTGSMHDIGEQGCKDQWSDIQKQIKDLDPMFFDIIKQDK